VSDTLLCEEKHKAIDEKLDNHEKRLGVHGDRLDKLENSQIRTEVVVQNLCDQIKTLVDAMKEQQKSAQNLVLGIAGTTIMILIGFVIWYIQTH
jgi:hypothetical protein